MKIWCLLVDRGSRADLSKQPFIVWVQLMWWLEEAKLGVGRLLDAQHDLHLATGALNKAGCLQDDLRSTEWRYCVSTKLDLWLILCKGFK